LKSAIDLRRLDGCSNQRPTRDVSDNVSTAITSISQRSKSARCSPPPSQTASWPRPRSRRRRNDVDGYIIISNIRGEPLASDVGGEQALNIGKAGQIAQKIAPSPGSAISSVTSAHDVTRLRITPPTRAYYFKPKNMTCKIQSSQLACLILRHYKANQRAPAAPRPMLPRT
jgi:hypothetical protein